MPEQLGRDPLDDRRALEILQQARVEIDLTDHDTPARIVEKLGLGHIASGKTVEVIDTTEHGLSAEEIDRGVEEGRIRIRGWGIDILQ